MARTWAGALTVAEPAAAALAGGHEASLPDGRAAPPDGLAAPVAVRAGAAADWAEADLADPTRG
jgi:hypothetical protein